MFDALEMIASKHLENFTLVDEDNRVVIETNEMVPKEILFVLLEHISSEQRLLGILPVNTPIALRCENRTHTIEFPLRKGLGKYQKRKMAQDLKQFNRETRLQELQDNIKNLRTNAVSTIKTKTTSVFKNNKITEIRQVSKLRSNSNKIKLGSIQETPDEAEPIPMQFNHKGVFVGYLKDMELQPNFDHTDIEGARFFFIKNNIEYFIDTPINITSGNLYYELQKATAATGEDGHNLELGAGTKVMIQKTQDNNYIVKIKKKI
ncbi:MAG: hypothetical protein QM571_07835 [Micrococcaceae bacterium]